MFPNPPRADLSGKILVDDVHHVEQTAEVKQFLQKRKTLLINVPPPLDVSVNKPLKNAVKIQFEKHLYAGQSHNTWKARYQSEG